MSDIITEGKTPGEIRDTIHDLLIEGHRRSDLRLVPGRLAEGFWTNTKPNRFVDEFKPGDLFFGVTVTKRHETQKPLGSW